MKPRLTCIRREPLELELCPPCERRECREDMLGESAKLLGLVPDSLNREIESNLLTANIEKTVCPEAMQIYH
jgi:hypothetical protein